MSSPAGFNHVTLNLLTFLKNGKFKSCVKFAEEEEENWA
jgi:hypothetical protein